jgi:hypothetical protein
MNSSLPWPDGAEVLPIAPLRPVLDRLASLVTVHEQDAAMVPGLAVTEDEVVADPPPALEQLVDELGGITLRDLPVLTLLVENRTDVGPYTLLGEATSYYPLYETPDTAVVLTLDEHGTPGVVHGIGEDLALQLAAPDLPTYLDLFTDALEATLTELSSRGPAEDDTASARTDAAEQLMDVHLFAAILGMVEDVPEAELVAPAEGEADGALALADLRGAALGTRVDPMEVESDGDPLEMHLTWRERGLVIAVHGG